MFVQRRLLRLAWSTAARPLLLTCLLGLSSILAGVATAVLVAESVRRVFAGAGIAELAVPIVAAVGTVVVRAALTWLRDVAAHRTAGVVKLAVRQRLVAQLVALGPLATHERASGDVGATLGDGVEALQAYVGLYLPQAVVAVIAPILLVAGMVVIDPVVGGVVLAAAAVVPVARPLFGRMLGRRGQEHWDAYRELSARTLDALQGMATLKLLGASRRHGDELREVTSRLYHATVNNLGISLLVYVLITAAMGIGTAAAAGVGAVRFAQGALDAGGLLIVLFLAAECFKPLLELQDYWHEGFHGVAAGTGIVELLDAEPRVRDTGRTTRPDVATPEIRFRGVTVTYPGGEVPALRAVDLVVPSGAKVAVVGRSGAGKSTLIALLLRELDPDHGAVEVAGTDLRALRLTEARRWTTVVSQDVHLFHGTVADNLRLAAPDATDEDLWKALERAQLAEPLQALPDGLATALGERGARLSGGERQRLAIARALLRDAPVLVLDEATSAIDGAGEAAIQRALATLARGRTTLVIAHRLSTVLDADQVVVLDAGRVVEAGPPRQLLDDTDGRFHALVAAQLVGAAGHRGRS